MLPMNRDLAEWILKYFISAGIPHSVFFFWVYLSFTLQKFAFKVVIVSWCLGLFP